MTGIHARFRLDWPGFALDVDLRLPATGVTVLFGRSGSGKTTLLRCIAGLERTPRGYLNVDGDVWQDGDRWVPTHKRPLGYVFQEASLFPHLSVMGNLRFGMQRVAGHHNRRLIRQSNCSGSVICSLASPGAFREANASVLALPARLQSGRSCC